MELLSIPVKLFGVMFIMAVSVDSDSFWTPPMYTNDGWSTQGSVTLEAGYNDTLYYIAGDAVINASCISAFWSTTDSISSRSPPITVMLLPWPIIADAYANQITYSSLVRNAVAGTVSSGRLTGNFTASVNPVQAYAVMFRSTAPGVSTVTSITQRFSSGDCSTVPRSAPSNKVGLFDFIGGFRQFTGSLPPSISGVSCLAYGLAARTFTYQDLSNQPIDVFNMYRAQANIQNLDQDLVLRDATNPLLPPRLAGAGSGTVPATLTSGRCQTTSSRSSCFAYTDGLDPNKTYTLWFASGNSFICRQRQGYTAAPAFAVFQAYGAASGSCATILPGAVADNATVAKLAGQSVPPQASSSIPPRGVITPTNDTSFQTAVTNQSIPCSTEATAQIGGGQVSTTIRYPYAISLRYLNEQRLPIHECGATAISSLLLLTAAHCCQSATQSSVRFQDLQSSNGGTIPAGQAPRAYIGATCIGGEGFDSQIVEKIYIPSAWNGTLQSGSDICLMRLAKPFDLTAAPTGFNLTYPTLSNSSTDFDTKTNVTTVYKTIGWGLRIGLTQSTQLREAQLLPLASETCKRNFEFPAPDKEVIPVTIGQICTQSFMGSTTCKGDSGGPLIKINTAKDNAQGDVIVGVVSAGDTELCSPGQGNTLYSNVNAFNLALTGSVTADSGPCSSARLMVQPNSFIPCGLQGLLSGAQNAAG